MSGDSSEWRGRTGREVEMIMSLVVVEGGWWVS